MEWMETHRNPEVKPPWIASSNTLTAKIQSDRAICPAKSNQKNDY